MGSVYQLYSASYRDDAQLMLLIHERITWFSTVRLKEVRLLFVTSARSSQSSLECRSHAYIHFLIIVQMSDKFKINDLKIAIFVAFLGLIIVGDLTSTNKHEEAVHDDKSEDELYCRDDENKPVDWFVTYKLPGGKSKHWTNGGNMYAYITNRTIDSGWKLSTMKISCGSSMIGRTLAPLYEDNPDEELRWIIYNDEEPRQRTKNNRGHTKGVVITNSTNLLWLIHSVPGFPRAPPISIDKYFSSSLEKSQSFMCISMPITQYDTIYKQLMCNEIWSYSEKSENIYNEGIKPTKKYTVEGECKQKATITSLGGVEFISFAKNTASNIELYSDMVSLELTSKLRVQSYTKDTLCLPATVNVRNVKTLHWEFKDPYIDTLDYGTSRDHSKWAISEDDAESKHWTCIGDINREKTQRKRGGGAVCVQLEKLWSAFTHLFKECDEYIEVPSQEGPSEKVPSEEVPSEEVPSEEVPSEEVPSEEVPSEEVPSKEVPSKEVPSAATIEDKVLAELELLKLDK